MTDIFALNAINLIAQHLPKAIAEPNNQEARSQQMLGSMYAGLAFSNAILGAVHAMAHSLGGLLDLPHGQCNAILLEHVIDYNFSASPERYTVIGKAMGATIDPAMPLNEKHERTLAAFRSFKQAVGMTTTLAELGVRPEDIEALARNAMNDPCMATNPMDPNPSDIRAIFEKAL